MTFVALSCRKDRFALVEVGFAFAAADEISKLVNGPLFDQLSMSVVVGCSVLRSRFGFEDRCQCGALRIRDMLECSLLDVFVDLVVHIGESSLKQASVPIVLDAERLNLLSLHELELLQLVSLHLLLAQDLLDLANLLRQRLNVRFFGHECFAQVTDCLLIKLQRVVLRE